MLFSLHFKWASGLWIATPSTTYLVNVLAAASNKPCIQGNTGSRKPEVIILMQSPGQHMYSGCCCC
jgi:hypothetical protein